jgi:hypothetical protein
LTISGYGTGASVSHEEDGEPKGVVSIMDGPYKLQNGFSGTLNILLLPFLFDPREAYSRVEDC